MRFARGDKFFSEREAVLRHAPAIHQYRVYCASAIDLTVELLTEDGGSLEPITVTGAATTALNLSDLIETEGTITDALFARCIGAYVTNNSGDIVFVNTGLTRDGTVLSDPGLTSAITWADGQTYQIGVII